MAGTDVPRLAVSSSAEEWARTADSLFHNRRYMQAMHCYERACLPKDKAVAYAYYLREQARSTAALLRKDPKGLSQAYITAAEAFLISAGEAVSGQQTYYRIAAQCYEDGGEYNNAARMYLLAQMFAESAQLFRKAGNFSDAVQVVKAHADGIPQTVSDSIINVSRLFYLRESKLKYVHTLLSPSWLLTSFYHQ